MPIQLEVMNQHALQALTRDLGQIPNKLASRGRLRKALESIRDNVIIPSYEEEFKSGGKVEPWDPISPNTALFGRKSSRGATFSTDQISVVNTKGLIPLTDRGRFARSARAKARFNIRDNRMSYGNFPDSMSWWAIHDQGLVDDLIPRRPWSLQFTQTQGDVNTIIDITWDYVKDSIDSALTRRVYR